MMQDILYDLMEDATMSEAERRLKREMEESRKAKEHNETFHVALPKLVGRSSVTGGAGKTLNRNRVSNRNPEDLKQGADNWQPRPKTGGKAKRKKDEKGFHLAPL